MGILMTFNAVERNMKSGILLRNIEIMRLPMACVTLGNRLVSVLMTIYALQSIMVCRALRKVFACTIVATYA